MNFKPKITLEKFLLDNSTIEKKFILDFFGFQKENADINKGHFNIDLELVAIWLHAQKHKLVETLKNSYTKNIDYVSATSIDNKDKHGGQNKIDYFITPSTFKLLCMRSKTERSEKVRLYYIQLEMLVDKYKEKIISDVLKENKKLKRDLRKETFSGKSLIYVIRLENGYYKIGKAKNMKQRKQIYDTGTLHKLKVVYYFETNEIDNLEQCIKGLLYDFRFKKNKEVFLLTYH